MRMRVLKVKSTAATTTNGEEGRITGAGKVMKIMAREKKSGKENGGSLSYELSAGDGLDGATVYNLFITLC